MNGAKVLIAADILERDRQHLEKELKNKGIKFVWKNKAKDIRMALSNNGSIDGIVIGDSLDKKQISTGFIRETKSRFSLPMIGFSNEERYQDRLKKEGCSFVCDFDSLPQTILFALGL